MYQSMHRCNGSNSHCKSIRSSINTDLIGEVEYQKSMDTSPSALLACRMSCFSGLRKKESKCLM